MRLIAVIALGATLVGCATTQKMNAVSVGMTKAEVVAALGTPDESRATEGTEYLIYKLRGSVSPGATVGCAFGGLLLLGANYASPKCSGESNDYFVQIQSGKVYSYGRVGDFDSTKTPEETVNVNVSHK